MRHVGIITLAELKRVVNNRRQLFILILGPILLCAAMGFVAYRSPQDINAILFVDQTPQSSPVNQQVRDIINTIDNYEREDGSKPFSVELKLSSISSKEEVMQRLDKGGTRAVIVLKQGQDGIESIKVISDITEPTVRQITELELGGILKSYSNKISVEFLTAEGIPPELATQIVSPFEPTLETNVREDVGFFDFMASALIVLMAMAIPLLVAVTAITSERSKGTIERIFVSPYKKSEFITGKMLAYGVFAIMVAILIIVTLKLVHHVTLGNIGLVLLIAALVGINAVIFGLLISSITNSEQQSILLGIASFCTFMILMTFIWPLETMHPAITYLAYATPYIYGVDAIRHINLVEGWGFSHVWRELVILCGFIVVQAIAAMLVLRREVR